MIIFDFDDLSKSVTIYILAYVKDGYEYYLNPEGIPSKCYRGQEPVCFAYCPVEDFGNYVKVRKTMIMPVDTSSLDDLTGVSYRCFSDPNLTN